MVAHQWALTSVGVGPFNAEPFATFVCLACNTALNMEAGRRPRALPFLGCEGRTGENQYRGVRVRAHPPR